jgi:Zn finger protein HypA/HybF involved in hydrogenase expression
MSIYKSQIYCINCNTNLTDNETLMLWCEQCERIFLKLDARQLKGQCLIVSRFIVTICEDWYENKRRTACLYK